MRILLLEDLDSFAEALMLQLTKTRELGPVGIDRIATELEFRRRLPELVEDSFNVAIFDVMVCWCTLEDLETPEGQAIPPEVNAERNGEKKWRAGVRCQQLYAEALAKAGKPPVPCIFYSVLDEEDLKGELGGTPLVVKQGEMTPLVRAIHTASAA
jgi:hypothetical protein